MEIQRSIEGNEDDIAQQEQGERDDPEDYSEVVNNLLITMNIIVNKLNRLLEETIRDLQQQVRIQERGNGRRWVTHAASTPTTATVQISSMQ